MSQAQMVRTKIRIDWFSSFREKVKDVFTSQFGYLKSNPHLWKKITIQAQTSIFVWKCSTQKYKKKVQFGGGIKF